MKILVTGGAGFIGSHIVDALLLKGDNVVIVDNLSSGSMNNISPGAVFYKVDIRAVVLEEIFARHKPDIVFHEAANVRVTDSVNDPFFDADTNILGSLNVISNCIKFKITKLIYASSCAMYGDPEYLPVDEKHPVNPTSPYGISKHTVEHYLNYYRASKKLDYIALRYGNVYGPRQNVHGEAGVVAIFANRMLLDEQPVIYGVGSTRPYVYVGDIVKANMLAMNSLKSGSYNIGTDRETTTDDIFTLLSKELTYSKPPRYEKKRPGEIEHMSLNCSKAAIELNWHPEIALEQGISKTAAFYTANLQKV